MLNWGNRRRTNGTILVEADLAGHHSLTQAHFKNLGQLGDGTNPTGQEHSNTAIGPLDGPEGEALPGRWNAPGPPSLISAVPGPPDVLLVEGIALYAHLGNSSSCWTVVAVLFYGFFSH